MRLWHEQSEVCFKHHPWFCRFSVFMCSKQWHFWLASGHGAWLANLFKSLHQKGVATAVVPLSVTQAATSRVHNMFSTVIPLPLLLLCFCANGRWMNEHLGYRRARVCMWWCICVCACVRGWGIHCCVYILFLKFAEYISVDLVKHRVSEIQCFRNDSYYYYFTSVMEY